MPCQLLGDCGAIKRCFLKNTTLVFDSQAAAVMMHFLEPPPNVEERGERSISEQGLGKESRTPVGFAPYEGLPACSEGGAPKEHAELGVHQAGSGCPTLSFKSRTIHSLSLSLFVQNGAAFISLQKVVWTFTLWV